MVGVERFELPTSCSQSRRATGLRYTPKGKVRKDQLFFQTRDEKARSMLAASILRFIQELVEASEHWEVKTQGILAASRTC